MNDKRAGTPNIDTPSIKPQSGLWDRREVFAASAAVAAWAALGPARAALATQDNAAAFHMVIADRDFAESRAFAEKAARAGQRITWIEKDDITPLWYDHLDHLWRHKPAAIAGLTGHGALFCLERLAMDRGLRVAFKREHPPSLYSWVIAPKSARAIAGGIV